MPHRRTSPQVFLKSRELRQDLTPAERKLWGLLRRHGVGDTHFRIQHAIGRYIVDFAAPQQKLVIELDGRQHLDEEEYDAERSAFLESKGYRVLRFWNSEVENNIERVMIAILEALESKQ